MKKAVFYISTVLIAVYVAAAFFWTDAMGQNEKCRGVIVDVKNGDDSVKFVTDRFILSEIRRLGFSVAGKPLASIDAEAIERAFDKQFYVEDVECYKCSDNTLQLDIYPVKPLLRVFDKSGSYYINRKGKRIPAMSDIFVDVPVAYGNIGGAFPPVRLLPLADELSANPELRSLVSAIEVADSSNVYIVPNIAGHIVNIGAPDNLKEKFGKLLRMYREVMPVKGWNAYDTINLKWDGQITATKRYAVPRLWIQKNHDLGHDELPDPQQTVAVHYETDTAGVETKKIN